MEFWCHLLLLIEFFINSIVSDKSCGGQKQLVQKLRSEKQISLLHLSKTYLSDYRFLCKNFKTCFAVIFFKYSVQGYMDFFCQTKKAELQKSNFFRGNAKIKLPVRQFLFSFCLKHHNCKKIQYKMTQRYRILCILKMLQYISDFNYFTIASELMSVFQGDILVFHFYLTLKQSI